jgi:hypothetical protein
VVALYIALPRTMLTRNGCVCRSMHRDMVPKPYLPLFFAGKWVADLLCEILVRDGPTGEPLLAFTHDTGISRLRRHRLRKRLHGRCVDKVIRDIKGDSDIDPYDACMLLSMAQCLSNLNSHEILQVSISSARLAALAECRAQALPPRSSPGPQGALPLLGHHSTCIPALPRRPL